MVQTQEQNLTVQISDLLQQVEALRDNVAELEQNVRQMDDDVDDVQIEMNNIKVLEKKKVEEKLEVEEKKKKAVVLEVEEKKKKAVVEDVKEAVPAVEEAVLEIVSVDELLALYFKEKKQLGYLDSVAQKQKTKVGMVTDHIKRKTAGKIIEIETDDEINILQTDGVDNVVKFFHIRIWSLSFEGSDMWTSFTSKKDFDMYGLPSPSKCEASIRECWEYVGWVDNVLGLRDKSAAIEELRISFSLNEAHQSYIDRWIRFALAKKVVRLDLNLVQTHFPRLYTFPEKVLCGNESNSWGFKDLRLIRMVYVTLSDGALEIFLRSCPLLEEIYLARCRGLSTVKIVSPLLALKRLTLFLCYDLESVEVRDSNLVYFMYRGYSLHLKHFILKNVPLLVEMNVGGRVPVKMDEFLAMFSSCLPQVEKLTIVKRDTLSIMEADMICSSVKMSNLKQFVWKFELNGAVMNLEAVTILVGAMPLLQRLVVMAYGDVRKGSVDRCFNHMRRYTRTHTYSNLKQVEYVGYHGDVDELAILGHFLDKATELEEVIIHPPKETCVDNRFDEYTKQDIDAFRAFAKAQLTTRLPSTVTLKIL